MMNLEANDKKKILEIFSANLATYRKAMKLSQEEFGALIGITRQTVSSIERGAYPLTWSIFLSCLFICASHVRAKKLILNAFAGEESLLRYLTGMMGDGSAKSISTGHGYARQVFFGTCTVRDDADYSIVDCDASVEELFGVRLKNGVKCDYISLIHPEDRETIRRILDEKIRKQMVVCIEHRVVTAEQQVVSVQCFVRRQKKMMKNGLFDITITQLTGEMLRKRQVTGLLTTLPVGIAVFDYQGRISHDNVPEIYYANEAFYNVIGHTAEQFASIHNNYLSEIVAPDDQKNVARLFDTKTEAETVMEAEFRVNRFDGSVAWVHCNALVVSRSIDGASLVSCAFTEITKRINAEMSMKHQLDHYRQLEETSDDIQFGYSVADDRISLPAKVANMLGTDSMIPHFLEKNLLRKFVHEEDYDTCASLIETVKSTGENTKGEVRLKLDGREYRWCRMNVIGAKDEEGKVSYLYGRIAQIDEERKIRKERSNDRILINRLSSTDRLTGLYNRTAFRARLQETLADPEMEPVHAVIYCDINDFSYINEKYGYPAGDRMLREFAAMFQRKGKKCFACRIHSDYFLIYVNGESKEQVIAKLRSWSKVFVEHQLKAYPGIDIQLSSGVYFLKKNDTDIPLAMDNANLARKQAKSGQENSYCIYSEELRAQRNHEQTIAGEIQNAIKNNKIEVFLQPKFSLKTKELIGAEALARWLMDDGTYRYPADFVPILEKTGHVTDLDFCIYTNVLQALRNWKKAGERLVPISINFGKNNKSFLKFDERISRLAEQYGVESKYIEIEVSEEMLLAEKEGASDSIRDLQNRGFKITLDDFGSGRESLSMLINAPVNIVKIGRTFLQRIGQGEMEKNYVRCMCEMISSVKKDAVFEGVEMQEQADFLAGCGFTTAQGYLFERPIPLEEFENKYLKEHFLPSA
ncbi:MAG: EAL domain-containing protein [Lachnospiraceae bacterium]|nr:EAL domain-containing protein [Lachnospiraceae bacterium]